MNIIELKKYTYYIYTYTYTIYYYTYTQCTTKNVQSKNQ